MINLPSQFEKNILISLIETLTWKLMVLEQKLAKISAAAMTSSSFKAKHNYEIMKE